MKEDGIFKGLAQLWNSSRCQHEWHVWVPALQHTLLGQERQTAGVRGWVSSAPAARRER